MVNTNSRDNVSKNDDRIDKLADQISNLVEIVKKQVIAPAKAVEKTYVTCGGAHAYYDCITTDSNQPSVCAATGSYNQVSSPNQDSHQIPPPGFAPVQNNPNRYNQGQGNYFNQANNINQGNNFRGNNFQNNQGYRAQMNNVPNFQNQGFQNQPFSVPNNQIQPNVPNEFSSYMKSNEIMIKSMQNQINVLRGDFNKHKENLRRNLNNDMRSILGSFFQNQLSTLGTLLSNTMPNSKGEMKAVTTRSGLAYEGPSIPTNSPLEKVDEQNTKEIMDKEHSNCPGSTAQILLANKDKLFELAKVPLNENCSAMLLKKLPENLGDPDGIDIACEEFVQDVLDFQYNLKSSIPTLVSDSLIPESDSSKEPIVKSSSPTLTSFGENPFQLPQMDLKLAEESKAKYSIEEPPELELKELSSHLEKDHFPLPFMDQMLERLAGNEFYCFLDGFSREGIVLGHKISKSGIEVDRAKVDVISKLPHSTTVKGVRSFLGHVGFYRRFIQDFSKIARPVTHLLEKETPFVFSKECIDAFNTLKKKKKLTDAPILVVPDWNLPFELMCDASDFAIGAVLGQRKMKHF
uniref:Reverse transcriptase domain-containing protein n=1 Tax=Tanacetum cinerariifolium TaxID=118510 RepID=A0A6L2KCE0_TANCI|nr:reverse transcriptase domain-containing protein [Tanacetum cinerariifolium]